MCRGPAKDSRAWNVQPTAAIEQLRSLGGEFSAACLPDALGALGCHPLARSVSPRFVSDAPFHGRHPRAARSSRHSRNKHRSNSPAHFTDKRPAPFAHSHGNASCNEWITTTAVFPVSAAGCARAYPRNDRINCSDVAFSGGHDPSSLFPDFIGKHRQILHCQHIAPAEQGWRGIGNSDVLFLPVIARSMYRRHLPSKDKTASSLPCPGAARARALAPRGR